MDTLLSIGLLASISNATLVGQNAALSSHFNFGENVTGDISICEVRVPSKGVAPCTYYETLGFWGNKGNSTGNGYAGIQESDDRRGNKVHIFSIWHSMDDPSDTANFPYAAYLGHGTTAEHFGGEGVGLKTWNFALRWQPDVWYTHVIRAWDVGKDTHYGFFVRDGASGVWRHLSTIGVKEPRIRIKGPNDAFIEDWKDTGKNMREVHLRHIWRRDGQGEWHPAQSGRYTPNRGDCLPGKRSHHYKNNWDAGTRKDSTGDFYYMRSGGSQTRPSPPLKYPDNMNHVFSVENKADRPDYQKAKIKKISITKKASGLNLVWSMEETSLPQFSYKIELFDNAECAGDPLLSKSEWRPETREVNIDWMPSDHQTVHLRLSIADIFDQSVKEVRMVTLSK
ncbi:DUF3472 domain-containing protein [Verrucomicrobiaceae bacterium N1E253]|uniref:DUF3472 domain-containing protein n=1 Tax=Oceaniferula marina TaxID=2748318 RepID=A0A851GI19_9BACT|nr:DUF3472 domain-containing protein [Oceaniferula marina]NWK57428.1 DUF3472 domain-containing protein [Oceaniferula marina]